MPAITASMVGELRAKTDAPMMECKKALTEADGDMARAEEILRVKLGNKAGKAAARITAEGVVAAAVDGTTGALVEVNCETDFVARTEEFQKLVKDLAMQVAGLGATYVDVDHIPADVLAAKKATLVADDAVQGKPENIREKIVEGQLNKWYKEVCLLEQPFRDEDRTVRELVTERIATIGENIRVRRFIRFVLGEEM
jgi:elongation factor Ts